MFPPQFPHRPRSPVRPSGTGNIEHGGDIIRDFAPSGFWARINAQPDPETNAYGFARTDDGTPVITSEVEDPFPVLALEGDDDDHGAESLPDGRWRGTGDPENSLAAFEVTGRTDVPTDGSVVVWLEPLAAYPGYGFTYTPPGGAVSSLQSRFGPFVLTGASGTYQDTGYRLELPAAGTYLLIVDCLGHLATLAATSVAGLAGIGFRLYDETADDPVPYGECLVCMTQRNPDPAFTEVDLRRLTFSILYTVTEPTTLRYDGWRGFALHTVVTSRLEESILSYLKLS